MPALVGGFGNYFLPIHLGAPDYLNYLNNLDSPLLNTSPIICFTNKNDNLSASLPLYTQESGESVGKQATRNNLEFLGPYLAGLFEGKGKIVLSKTIIVHSVVKDLSPSISITFVNKDLPLINKFIKIFGGRLIFKDRTNAIVWIISSHKELVNMINLLNGYLRTPKINKFNKLIVWLNNKYNYNIPIHSPDTTLFFENGWLAGFIDACGEFKVKFAEKILCAKTFKFITKGRNEVRFTLEQKNNENKMVVKKNISSYEALMLQIYSFFSVPTKFIQSTLNEDKTYFTVEVFSLTKLNVLIQYLKTYPLLTAKRNDYDDWVKIYNLLLDNKDLTYSSKLKIKQIESFMNKKRGKFYWYHLNYLNKVQ